MSSRPCLTTGCEFFGSAEKKGYCSKCFLAVQPKKTSSSSSSASPREKHATSPSPGSSSSRDHREKRDKSSKASRTSKSSKTDTSTPTIVASDLSFTLNGQAVVVPSPDPRVRLNDWLRRDANNGQGYTGTKHSCGEAGCGACTVLLTDPTSKKTIPVNSCLRPLVSVAGMEVTTIEGTGSERAGFSAVQKAVAAYNGTQCGFCTPGMVMQMEGLLAETEAEQRSPTEQEIEDRFDGNLCRCTGYRSILAAMKTFASDYSGHDRAISVAERRKVLTALLEDAQLKSGPNTELTDIEEICASRAGVSKGQARSALGKLGSSCATRKTPRSAAVDAAAAAGDSCCASKAGKKDHAHSSCCSSKSDKTVSFTAADGTTWYAPTTIAQVYSILSAFPLAATQIVGGNTSAGIYKDQTPTALITLADVQGPLHSCTTQADGIVIGAAVSINDWRSFMQDLVSTRNGGTWTQWQVQPFQVLLDHLQRVANTPVRASGSWAGNLAMCRRWNFLSDICVMLMAAGATLSLGSASKKYADISLSDFLALDITGLLIESCTIRIAPAQTQNFLTYKTMLRHVNSHAIVNAGFRCNVSAGTPSQPTFVFGGIAQYPMRFSKTEAAFSAGTNCWGAAGKQLLANCLTVLQSEVAEQQWAQWNVDGRGPYRAQAAVTLFYKFFLSLQPTSGPNALSPSLVSAIDPWPQRGLSHGSQSWETDPNEYPLSQPIEKLSAITQASGEARYADDAPAAPNELFVAFVLSEHADAKIDSIDVSAAMAAPGVVDVLTAASITKSANVWGPMVSDEELFASQRVVFSGQVVAAVCGRSQTEADAATKLVNVSYSDINSKPILSIDDAIAANSFFVIPNVSPPPPVTSGNIDQGFSQATTIIDGEWNQDANQYHFYMETQSGRVAPFDNAGGDTSGDVGPCASGVIVTGAMQDPSGMQAMIAKTLNIPHHLVQAETTRSGGGFGGKGSRNMPLHAVTALAAQKHGVPARFRLDLNTNMQNVGKRNQFRCIYKIGLDATGKMIAMKLDMYMNQGAWFDAAAGCIMAASVTVDNCYYCPNVLVTMYIAKTNLPANTSTRGPGWVVGSALAEHMIEHVGVASGLGGDAARQVNFYQTGQNTPYNSPIPNFEIPQMWSTLRTSANFDTRVAAVQEFNKNNRWIKKGIVCIPIKFGAFWGASGSALLQVFRDGTVAVSHNGCEIGQGIHTKVAQAAAYRLGIPLDLVRVRSTSTEKTPNAAGTGGSVTSALCVAATLDACDKLLAKLQGISGTTWQQRITNALSNGTIDLGTKGWHLLPNPAQGPFAYLAYSVGIHEVTVDCLTGYVQVDRVDILQDVGTSMNVLIDVGQVEGAFMMGLGLHLTEQILYDDLGHLLSDGTWEYKPPSAMDIPVEFNVALLKNAPNPTGIVHSKVVGEPPLCQGVGVLLAVQQAVGAARADAQKPGYFAFDSPATVPRTQQSVEIDVEQLTF